MMYNIPLLIRKILFQRQSADLAQHTASLNRKSNATSFPGSPP